MGRNRYKPNCGRDATLYHNDCLMINYNLLIVLPCRPLQRMCAGMLLAACSFVMAAFIQIAIQVSYSSRMLQTQSTFVWALQVSDYFPILGKGLELTCN